MILLIPLVLAFLIWSHRKDLNQQAYVYADPWRAAFMEMAAADPNLYWV